MVSALVAAALIAVTTPTPDAPVPATAPVLISPAPTGSPCLRTLKFGGSLYLDTDSRVPSSEVGPQVGTTDPNPARCGLPDRLIVYRHSGHSTADEVVFYVSAGEPELFRSAGNTGFPYQDLLKWLVLALVVGVLLFAALPALIGHLRQPTIGGDDSEGPPAA